ncbi:MAG: T9SS C-terminal target domain-containing protein [Balneolaceae bacterium]|nr:MAG: T9SS C-terminal target domain-containing protein [Balneolaceae bacterium]
MDQSGLDLYLNDLKRGVSMRLSEDVSYQFTIEQAAKSPVDPFSIISNGPQKAAAISPSRFTISTMPAAREGSELPGSIALYQNYPNPFNPTTQIRYELPQQETIRLTVYDMVGRQVAVLVNETMQAGVHTVTFDAGNLSSGVYIYTLKVGGDVHMRKFTLLK